MSMDEQYAQMQQFSSALAQFNDHLRVSVEALNAQHEQVSPHWQDEMRRTYDAHWDPLEQAMSKYLLREGPAYLEFLVRKLRYLEGFLYGRY
jgi:uncharacterized protein YukE